MPRRRRVDVEKREGLLILINLVTGNLALDNLCKNRVLHGFSIHRHSVLASQKYRFGSSVSRLCAIAYNRDMKQITKARLADGLLKAIAITSVTAVGLLAPNGLKHLDKSLQHFLDNMDKRERNRQISEALSYLRYKQLITDDYQHGLRATEKALRRLDTREVNAINITPRGPWDGVWRIVFFDIPEPLKTKRDQFAGHLKRLGFGVLQRSVFICPYPCREEVTLMARYYKIDRYITYIETSYIDNDAPLKEHFNL